MPDQKKNEENEDTEEVAEFQADTTERDEGRTDLPWSSDSGDDSPKETGTTTKSGSEGKESGSGSGSGTKK